MYPGSHCVIFHGLAILQLKTNGNPAKWAPTAIKEVILFTIPKTNKDKKLQKYNPGIIPRLYTFSFMYILRTNPE
jgi:hypothetical protein